jgi:hypothetical protein
VLHIEVSVDLCFWFLCFIDHDFMLSFILVSLIYPNFLISIVVELHLTILCRLIMLVTIEGSEQLYAGDNTNYEVMSD